MSLIPFGFWGAPQGPIILSTGWKGARFNGYFNDVVSWFSTATPHGQVDNNRVQLNSFSSNADLYSWIWYGYFLAPATGSYTFFTASDDASYLWIGNSALAPSIANALVNNGGLHGVQETSGTVSLEAGRYYAVLVMFGENGGGDSISVSFQGPGITKTTNGTGYYFGGQESYAGNWIGGVGSFAQSPSGSGSGGSGLVTDQLICHLDSRNPSSYPGGGTTWFDLTGNSNASLNAAFWTGVIGSHAGYMDFNQSSGHYADLNLVGVNSSTPVVTVEMWLRPYNMGVYAGMLFGFLTYDFYHPNSGLGFNTGAGDLRGLAPSQIQNLNFYGQWHHLVCVMNQTTSYTGNKIYLDGTLIYNTAQIDGAENSGNRGFNNGQMRINGWRNNTSYPYEQDLTVFRVYKKELSLAEVLQNYNLDRNYAAFNRKENKNPVPEGCRLHFDFEGEWDWYSGSGSYVRDYSGFCRYGILSGGIGWNSAGGGNMQFRAANSRFVNTIRSSSEFGLFYGSVTFVAVVRSINQSFQEWFFGPEEPVSYGKNVRIGIGGSKVTYTHEANQVDSFSSFGAMVSNQWYHVAFSYDYNSYTVKIYLNGTVYVTNGFEERVTGNSTYFLGRVTNSYYSFDLGLFMIYNRVLDAQEISQLYNIQKTRFGL